MDKRTYTESKLARKFGYKQHSKHALNTSRISLYAATSNFIHALVSGTWSRVNLLPRRSGSTEAFLIPNCCWSTYTTISSRLIARLSLKQLMQKARVLRARRTNKFLISSRMSPSCKDSKSLR